MSDLSDFLQKFQIFKDKSGATTSDIKPTHTSYTGGSYRIPNEHLETFFQIYSKLIESGKYPFLLECPRKELDYGLVKIDFDFRYSEDSPERKYDHTLIKEISKIYREIILKYFDVPIKELTAYVTERSSSYKLEKEKNYRDGFHIMFDIGLPYSFQHVMRTMVIEILSARNLLQSVETKNPIQEVVDKSVVETANWFLYGSRKANLEPYKLTMEVDYENNELDVKKWKLKDLIPFLSIRKEIKKKEYRTKELEQEIKSKAPITIKTTQKMKEKKNLIEKHVSQNTTNFPENYEMIKSLVNILSDERCNSYKTWFELGACLFNMNESLLPLWIEFSKRSEKYNDGECEQYWLSHFRKENLNIASLHFWAKTDSPLEYEKIRRNSIRFKLEQSIRSPTHFDIALVVHEMYKHNIVCTSVKNKKWYRFNGNHWEYSDQGMCIRFLLSKEIANEYTKYAMECSQKILQINTQENDSDSGNENIIKALEEKSKSANKIASCLKTTSFKDNVVKECSELFLDLHFLEKLDNNPLLIGVQNGVYDLGKREFRLGRPDDFVSKKVGVNYIELDEQNEKIKNKLDFIQSFFQKILPIDSVRRYMWLTIASCLEGYTDQKFPILTGSGGNGKTILMEFLQETFGEYACTVSTGIFTHKQSSPSSATPEVARIRNVRLVSAEETEEGSALNVARMKELTGGNKITTRKLFEDVEQFKPQAHWFLVCNNLPKINSDDGGTWRRIHIVEFLSSFVDDPNDERYSGLPYVYEKDDQIGQKLVDCREVFFSYLVNSYYPDFKKNGIKEPKEVFTKTNAYRQDNDILFQFIRERICKEPKSVLKISEIYGDFKYWFKESGIDLKCPSQKELKVYFEKKFQSYGDHKKGNAGWKGIALIEKQVDLDTVAELSEKDI